MATSLEVIRDRRAVRRELRAACPNLPGVYGMIDLAGRLVYVGKSAHLRKRLITYFQGVDPHAAEFPRNARRRCAQGTADRPPRDADRLGSRRTRAACAAARARIDSRARADLNVRGRRRRRLAYVYLSSEDAPRFRIAAQLPKACRHHWGPFAHNGRLIRSVELLNRQFKLPDCPSQTTVRFADDGQLFPIVDRRCVCAVKSTGAWRRRARRGHDARRVSC